MRNLLFTILLVIASALLAGAAIYRFSCDSAIGAAARDGNAMQWLKSEFRLTDEQFAAIIGRSAKAGEMRLYRARVKLRQSLSFPTGA